MLFLLDNYDSFTYNLAQMFGELGANLHVARNDQVTVEEVEAMAPERLVISPGPCAPADAGISVELIRRLGPTIPTLGVCLGHQAIGEAFGNRTVRAHRVVHGKVGSVIHDGDALFDGIPSPFSVTRYHSLVTAPDLPPNLRAIAWSAESEDEGEIQAMRHNTYPVWGVQFHPESLFTESGKTLLSNFLEVVPAVAGEQVLG